MRRERLSLLNALEPLLSNVCGRIRIPFPGACSAVAVAPGRSATGAPILAKNFDYLPLAQPFYAVRASRPTGRLRSLDFTVAPLAGAVDGINEQGLCITYNYAFTVDAGPTTGTISMAISEALERCTTVAEAADWIGSRPRWGGGLLMLADATGDIASLELSATCSRIRRPAAGEGVLFHTNAFHTPDMCSLQVDSRAVFTNKAPVPLRGRRVLESSELRQLRLAQLIDQAGQIGPDELAGILSDHGPDNQPGDYTLCVHGSYWYTTASLQFFPCSRRLRVDYATTCSARYEELEV